MAGSNECNDKSAEFQVKLTTWAELGKIWLKCMQIKLKLMEFKISFMFLWYNELHFILSGSLLKMYNLTLV